MQVAAERTEQTVLVELGNGLALRVPTLLAVSLARRSGRHVSTEAAQLVPQLRHGSGDVPPWALLDVAGLSDILGCDPATRKEHLEFLRPESFSGSSPCRNTISVDLFDEANQNIQVVLIRS